MADNMKLITLANLSEYTTELKEKYAKKSDVTGIDTRLTAVEGAYVKTVNVNNTPQTVTENSVNITVPKALSELTNDKQFVDEDYVDEAIDTKIGSAYKAAGSAGADKWSTAPTEDDEGKVYNASAQFTTNANFVDNDGKTYPAGTNVVVVKEGQSYKYDVLSGFVDLSSYATMSYVDEKVQDIDLDDYSTTTETQSWVNTQLQNYYDKSAIDGMLEDYVDSDDLASYVQRSELTTTLADYVKATDIETVSSTEIKALFD